MEVQSSFLTFASSSQSALQGCCELSGRKVPQKLSCFLDSSLHSFAKKTWIKLMGLMLLYMREGRGSVKVGLVCAAGLCISFLASFLKDRFVFHFLLPNFLPFLSLFCYKCPQSISFPVCLFFLLLPLSSDARYLGVLKAQKAGEYQK